MKRPGYYVENRYYGVRRAQAIARANYLTKLYGRPVAVQWEH